ncbi:1,5-anhydro-D-fructose reductase isoform X2 [Drosophila tropicalis]|uniref:1,5-anhydro-D-fructose reductase isoform X2 n=1 Tax=Drosophila tropicalis TaxID=46794 RepID=UPI0035AC0B0A
MLAEICKKSFIIGVTLCRYRVKSNFTNLRTICNLNMKLAPTVKLNNGYEMPVLGLGTYELKKSKCENAVRYALETGYRHIDTAYLYRNEALIGKVLSEEISAGKIQREQVFLVTKLWDIYHEPFRVLDACRMQLRLLNVEYIDLYLMHSPVGVNYLSDDDLMPHRNEELWTNNVDYLDTYRAMEKLVEMGLVRSLGVSNFNLAQLQRLIDNCHIKPVALQIECHIELIQWPLLKYCETENIAVTAYSPLGRPKLSKPLPDYYTDVQILEISKKYEKSPAQIVLRYLVDIGLIPIPKAAQINHLFENLQIFDFTLSVSERQKLEKWNKGLRIWKFEKAKYHQYYPY